MTASRARLNPESSSLRTRSLTRCCAGKRHRSIAALDVADPVREAAQRLRGGSEQRRSLGHDEHFHWPGHCGLPTFAVACVAISARAWQRPWRTVMTMPPGPQHAPFALTCRCIRAGYGARAKRPPPRRRPHGCSCEAASVQSKRTAPSRLKALSSDSAPCLALSTRILMSASVMGARPPSITKGCEYTGMMSAVCWAACCTVACA